MYSKEGFGGISLRGLREQGEKERKGVYFASLSYWSHGANGEKEKKAIRFAQLFVAQG